MNVDSLNQIEEVVIVGYSIVKVDTVDLNISYILEMERTNPNFEHKGNCGLNDFIVMYDNYSCIYFSMGCAWSCYKLYWTEKNDTTLFYSRNIENEIKQYKRDKNQILTHLNENGERVHIGSINHGFDFIVRNSQDYYMPFSSSCIEFKYYFRREEKISECHQTFYSSIIKEN